MVIKKPFTEWVTNISDRKMSLWQNRGKLPLQRLHTTTSNIRALYIPEYFSAIFFQMAEPGCWSFIQSSVLYYNLQLYLIILKNLEHL